MTSSDNRRRILVPVEGSYKEYDKFSAAFRQDPCWPDFMFLTDGSLDPAQMENALAVPDGGRSVDDALPVIEEWLRKGGYQGTFDQFCMVEFHQNWMMHTDPAASRRAMLGRFVNIVDSLRSLDYDALLCGAVSQFFPRCVTVISRALGKEVILYTQSLIPGREFIRVDDDDFGSAAIGRRMADPGIPAADASRVADEIFDAVIHGKKRGDYLGKLRRSFGDDVRIVRSIRNRLVPRSMSGKRLKYWFDRAIGRWLRARTWRHAAEERLPEGRFVFFPLHMPNEAQTLVRGYPFFEDVSVLLQIATLMPPDVALVVKEHPGYEGWLSLDALRRIQCFPNIVLVRSNISSHEIMARSLGVVTINSSVWFECFALRKPTVCLGRGIFSGYGVVAEAKTFDDVKRLVGQLVDAPDVLLPPDARISRFIEAYHHHSIEGRFYGLIVSDAGTFRQLVLGLLGEGSQ